jgi:arginase family enzyme
MNHQTNNIAPGRLSFEQVEYLLQTLLASVPVAGISVTIFNPRLDHNKLPKTCHKASAGHSGIALT